MLRTIAALALFALPACSQTKTANEAEAACQLDAEHFTAIYNDSGKRVGLLIELCMRQHGFKLNLDNCPAQPRVEKDTPVTSIAEILDEQEENPACYESA
jgi:hypothetical protein